MVYNHCQYILVGSGFTLAGVRAGTEEVGLTLRGSESLRVGPFGDGRAARLSARSTDKRAPGAASTAAVTSTAAAASTGGRGPAGRVFAVLAGEAAGWVLPAVILVLWQSAAMLGLLSESVLPRPTAVLRAGWDLTLSGELPHHIAVSASRAFVGLLIGGGIGFGFGLVNGLSKTALRSTDTLLQMIRNVPHLALIPLVILWFGIGEEAKLFLVALGVFFPIYVNTLHGIVTADPQLVEMGRCYGMSPATLFRRVILPGALPSIFVGLRFGLGIMWLTLIVAETIAAQSGIGYMAMQAREFLQTDVVMLAIVIYALLGKWADATTRLLERLCLSWHPAFQPR